jgi:hypothetical protein
MSTKKDKKNTFFIKECSKNNLEHVINFIKEDKELKLNLQKGFLVACTNGCLSVVKYLSETTSVKERLDLNAPDESFQWRSISNTALIDAYSNCQSEIIDYLLFEINIDVTDSTRKSIKMSGMHDLLNKIEKRNLFFQISEEMNTFEETPKSSKPKI